jgi:hypothetical protein
LGFSDSIIALAAGFLVGIGNALKTDTVEEKISCKTRVGDALIEKY